MIKFTYEGGGEMSELINNSVKGVNIIPTVLLGLVLLYWITVIIGVFYGVF